LKKLVASEKKKKRKNQVKRGLSRLKPHEKKISNRVAKSDGGYPKQVFGKNAWGKVTT